MPAKGTKSSPHSSVDYYWGMRQDSRYERWLCTKCDAEYFFESEPDAKVRAGPRQRLLDRRYAFHRCYRTCKKRVIVRHVLTPKPTPQPKQDPVLLRRLYGDEGKPGAKKSKAAS